MVFIGYVATTVIVMFLSACWSGYALSVLWGWFFAPTFNLPVISIPAAIGIAIIVGYMTKPEQESKTDGKSFGEVLATASVKAAIKPAFALGIGALVRLWM